MQTSTSDGRAVAVATKQPFALPETGEAMLTVKEVSAALGIGPTSVWKRVKCDPAFPQPVRYGTRCTRFRLSALRAYVAALSGGVQ